MSKDKDEIKEVLGSIFSGIVNAKNEEVKINYGELLAKLKATGYDLDDPEDFNTLVVYEANNALKFLGFEMCEPPHDMKNANKIKFLYLRYDFMEMHIRHLVQSKEGSGCCADKSRHILGVYKDYLVRGVIPESDFSKRPGYHIPKFGEYKLWIEYCDSLIQLYYGDLKNNLEVYQKLIQEEVHKYPATHYKWYATVKDCGEYLCHDAWDKDINPFDDESSTVYAGPDHYLIKAKKDDKSLEDYLIQDSILFTNWHLVPKCDVINIRCEKEELMV